MNDEYDELDVSSKDIHRTTKMAGIKLLDSDISIFVNHYGQRTPLLIVGRCQVDEREYAAIYDTDTEKAYAVEIVRVNGEIQEFRDLDGPAQDEEWGVISNFFLQKKVFDKNRIDMWIRNTRLRQKLALGRVPVPQTMMKRWEGRHQDRFSQE